MFVNMWQRLCNVANIDLWPQCLLPVCNVPLIEYTIEFLAISGVQEIFIIATMHAEQIKAYIE
jgi:translation initiation factor eIF-2B subunit epsilon